MEYLRQSTASQSVLIGPFVDDVDGNTDETGLTILNTDIRLSKNGGNMAAKNSGGGTHDEIGMYAITFDATDTDTVGTIKLVVHKSGSLHVYSEYTVLSQDIYDAIYGDSATLFADINVQVLDVMSVDTRGEPAQGKPGVNISIFSKIDFLYKAFRNRVTSNSSQIALYNNDSITIDHKAAHTDDLTIYDRSEMESGP